MARFKLISDIHLEFDIGYKPQPNMEDKDTILIIAGDLFPEYKSIIYKKNQEDELRWLSEMAEQFKSVVFVAGNHDIWGSNIDFYYKRFKEKLIENDVPSNVYLLQNDTIILDGVCIIGATLWTDFGNMNPLVMFDAKKYMMDYKYIKSNYDYRPITANRILTDHKISVEYIHKQLKEYANMKKVVVTHHAPSDLSKDTRFSDGNEYYTSDLSNLILEYGPDVWCHGHIHTNKDYMLGNTRILCNPKGYRSENSNGFKENLYFTL